MWSNPDSWPSGEVPGELEDVKIEAGVNMVLDIDTPILNVLTINGRLSFLNDAASPKDLTLTAR